MTYECFRVHSSPPDTLGPEQIKILKKYAIRPPENLAADQSCAGLLAGDHLFDLTFDLEKNVLLPDALHFALRIDTNQIPAAVRKAWLQIELAAVQAENPERRLTKVQRQEAKDAVAAQCDEAARSGQYRRMQQFPILWDTAHAALYFGGSSAGASDVCKELLEKAFALEVSRLACGQLADEWATQSRRRKALAAVTPARFVEDRSAGTIQWWNGQADNYDFLGNEFFLWLWWQWETQSDTLQLSDGSRLSGMFARTLTLQCPWGESGKGTITAEVPTSLPEAMQALRSGKLPRKAGLTLVRHDVQYDLTLQAETFAVQGARIRSEEKAEGRAVTQERVEGLRELQETIHLLFQAFCAVRVGDEWPGVLRQIRRWLHPKNA
jgi:hypothetical protein